MANDIDTEIFWGKPDSYEILFFSGNIILPFFKAEKNPQTNPKTNKPSPPPQKKVAHTCECSY